MNIMQLIMQPHFAFVLLSSLLCPFSKITPRNPDTMKFISFSSSATVLASLAGLLTTTLLPGADAHGHEIRSCINTAGDLRIFIEHWHYDLSIVTQAGTMIIRNDVTGVTAELTATGLANNIDVNNGGVLPGCASTTLVGECTIAPTYSEHDWAYFDFPYDCGTDVSYTLERGTTQVLTEACPALYPATINPYNDCPGAPSSSPSSSPSSFAPVPNPTATPVQLPSPFPTVAPTLAPTPCSDDPSFSFVVGTGATKKCGWLADKAARQTRHCGKFDVQAGCPLTCCNCGTCPTFSPTAAPVTAAPTPSPVSVAPTPSKGGKGTKAPVAAPSKGGNGKRVLRGH